MMRRCKNCSTRLPKYAESNPHQRAGFCDGECGWSYVKNNPGLMQKRSQEVQKKIQKQQQKAHKEQKRALRDNDTRHQRKLTQAAVQRLARLLDKGKPCVSCSRPDDGSVQFCGSHFLTKGAHPEMAMDPRNIMGACNQYCNLQLSGNISGNKHTHGYREGIIKRYGQKYLEWIEGDHPERKYTCGDFKVLRKLFNAEIRRLERGEGPSRDWRSLDYDILEAAKEFEISRKEQ